MADRGRQLRLLLWKDYLLRKRKLMTVGGVGWATLVLLTLYIVRANIDNEPHPTCQFTARALPSAGLLRSLQSFVCGVDNQCAPLDSYDEIPTYEDSRLTQLQRLVDPLLQNRSVVGVARVLPGALRLLGTAAAALDRPSVLQLVKHGLHVRDLFSEPGRVRRDVLVSRLGLNESTADLLLQAQIDFGGVLRGAVDRCDGSSLARVLITERAALAALAERLCALSDDELQAMLLQLVADLNYGRYLTMLGEVYASMGDEGVARVAAAMDAIRRLGHVASLVPRELGALLPAGADPRFSCCNLTIITKALDLIEPTFGDTEAFKSVRSIAGTVVSGIQWIHQLLERPAKTYSVEQASELVIHGIEADFTLDGFKNFSEEFKKTVGIAARVPHMDGDQIFNILSKITSFITKWLSKDSQHQVAFYSTLLTKFVEGAGRVVRDNVNIEQIVYGAFLRNPRAARVVSNLPGTLLVKAFEGLADPDRVQVLTAKLNSPEQIFCEDWRLQKFFQISVKEVPEVRQQFCSDEWRDVVVDLLRSLGVQDVKHSINGMASLLIQETLGKDTRGQLYSMEHSFRVLQQFVSELLELQSTPSTPVDWTRLMNVTQSADVVANITALSKQVLISVHGALAKEVVQQNTVLDIKLSPALHHLTTLVAALNEQLALTPPALLEDFKAAYPEILHTVLSTLLHEDKTLMLLSTHSEDMFCNGTHNASMYLDFPGDVDEEKVVSALCRMSVQIDEGLRADSVFGKALRRVLHSATGRPPAAVDWSTLIRGVQHLYLRLGEDYPFVLEPSFGLDRASRLLLPHRLDRLNNFWFGSEHPTRSAHLSINILFRLLDTLDNELFGIDSVAWSQLKLSLTSANGLLVICDEIFKIATAVNPSATPAAASGLPRITAGAVRELLQHAPVLVRDLADVVTGPLDTHIGSIISVMNASPPWPCSAEGLAGALGLRPRAALALQALETLLCADHSLRQEWARYSHAINLKMITLMDRANSTKFEPHIFLKFSRNFDALVRDADQLQKVLEVQFSGNDTEEKLTLAAALRYVENRFNQTDKLTVFRNLFMNVDLVLNGIISPSEYEGVPLTTLWEQYAACSNSSEPVTSCHQLGRAATVHSLKVLSVALGSVAGSLQTYFEEINGPDASVVQAVGFTKGTGLYVLFDKFADFVVVLLNSFWDYGFMNQVRRASLSEFWDCEALVETLAIPPGSRVSVQDVHRIRPYLCPSLLFWVSLPVGENTLLDIVSKPQYYIYSVPVENITSKFETAYNKILDLSELLTDIAKKNSNQTVTDEDLKIGSLQKKANNIIDYLASWRINETDASYILFDEISKKQLMTSIYLTRVVAMINKMDSSLADINVEEISKGISEEKFNKSQKDISVIQKKFKRKPAEAIALNFDLITDVAWKNIENYTISDAISSKCYKLINESVEPILVEDTKFLAQICAKDHQFVYGLLSRKVQNDWESARISLKNLITILGGNDNVTDITGFFKKRPDHINALKLSIKYSDEVGTALYLQYLHQTLLDQGVVSAFLAGDDWWSWLRARYGGPHAAAFFQWVERSPELAEDLLNHVHQIHVVRLARLVRDSKPAWWCSGEPLAGIVPDPRGLLTSLVRQLCALDRAELIAEVPMLRLVSQGYDNKLKLSKNVDYVQLESDTAAAERRMSRASVEPPAPRPPPWVTPARVRSLLDAARRLFSTDMLVNISFGVMENIVDASTLFLNSSGRDTSSGLTSSLKQLSLQLYKHQEYEELLCRLRMLSEDQVHETLTRDFHWDMALQELVASRNYTLLELNKALLELLQQARQLAGDTPGGTRLADCLAANVTRNAFGNASLFVSVLSHTLKLVRSQVPHLQDVKGFKQLPSLQQLHSAVAHRLHVEQPLIDLLGGASHVWAQLAGVFDNEELLTVLRSATVDLYWLNHNPRSIEQWLKPANCDTGRLCALCNCTELARVLTSAIDMQRVHHAETQLQSQQFWRLPFVSSTLLLLERMLEHTARLLGVGSRLLGGGSGLQPGSSLSAVLDTMLQLVRGDTAADVLYSVRSLEQLTHPLLQHTTLSAELRTLTTGLQHAARLRDYALRHVHLEVSLSDAFPEPSAVRDALVARGLSQPGFWSLAAPALRGGSVDLKPLLAGEIRLASSCSPTALARTLLPSSGTLPPPALNAAAQMCAALQQAPGLLPALLETANLTYFLDKVANVLLDQVYVASNLSQAEGQGVMQQSHLLLQLLPVIQTTMANVSRLLANEPVLQAFRNYTSLGDILSSPEVLSSAGNLVCGKPFVGNDNRFYRAVTQTRDFASEPDPLQLDSLPGETCRALYRDVVRMRGGKILWSFVKPVLRGRILYTPPSAAVRRIVREANASFALVAELTSILHDFSSSFPSIQQVSGHRAALRTLASSPMMNMLVTDGGGIADVDIDALFDDFGDLNELGSMLRRGSRLLHCISLDRFQPQPDEARLAAAAARLVRLNEFSAGLVFSSVQEKEGRPFDVEYTIRMDIENVPSTSRIRNQFWTAGPEGNFLEDMRYFRGFVQIQDLVDSAIVRLSRLHPRSKRQAEQDDTYGVYTQQIPYPSYTRDYFQSSLYESQALIVAFFFSLVFFVSSAIRFIVSEKENGTTMLLSTMGVPPWLQHLSWALASITELLLTSAAATLVLRAGRVLPRTQPALLFALLANFQLSVLMFCYLVSKVFRSASLAAVCGALLYLLTFMPFVIILALQAELSAVQILLTNLSMSSAFCSSLAAAARAEARGEGTRWVDLLPGTGGGEGGNSLGGGAAMVLLDSLLYLALACLVDKFFGPKRLRSNITKSTSTTEKAGVSISDICKVYGRSSRRPKLALDHVSVELQRGQVTTLLGHNGAGKTTLINIITGLLKPTSGRVVVRGDSPGTGAALGYCPQQDVLFDNLTVTEHLTLYASLKKGRADVAGEVRSMERALSLGSMGTAGRLSGGQRRRLSVALAFVGGPPLVVLDEPGCGVDMPARREIWALIGQLRADSTVLLTSHQLHEAELLSDRLVILHEGQVHTSGTPTEIKRTLGNGYNLIVNFPWDKTAAERQLTDDEQTAFEEKTKSLLSVIREVMPTAELVDAAWPELRFSLPCCDAEQDSGLVEVCTRLEACQDTLEYAYYTVDGSSLEQVMQHVCRGAGTREQPADTESGGVASAADMELAGSELAGAGPARASFAVQVRTLLHKRLLHYSRSWWMLTLVLLLPTLFVTVSMAFSMVRPPPDPERPLLLVPELYGNATTFIVPEPSAYSAEPPPTFAAGVMRDLMTQHHLSYVDWSQDVWNAPLPRGVSLPSTPVLLRWLVDSQPRYIENRYGGYSSAVKEGRSLLVVWYNNKGHHALPAHLSALSSAVLRRASREPRASIRTRSHPLKISSEQLSKSTLLQHVADAGISGLLLLAYCVLPAAGGAYLVAERSSGQALLQQLSGVNPPRYYLAALLADLAVIVINILLTVAVLSAFGFPVFVWRDNLPAICLLLLLFGFASSSLVHVVEKCFTEPSLANMALFCGGTFLGLSGLAILLILDIISSSEATQEARRILHGIFLMAPPFALGDGLLEVAKGTVQAQVLARFGMDTYVSPLSGPLAVHCWALLAVAIVSQIVNMLIEYDCLSYFTCRDTRIRNAAAAERRNEPPSVEAERRRVAKLGQREPLALRSLAHQHNGCGPGHADSTPGHADSTPGLRGVWLRRGARLVLRDVCLALPPGEVTALVGANGSGKSSTLAVLAGQLRPSAGELLHRPTVSYCPQRDALDPLLTVEETLRLYCRLRAIHHEDHAVGRALRAFELSAVRAVRCGRLSGGTRRRLSAALAFTSRAQLLLLDEPTSGMDDVVRRVVRAACAAWPRSLLMTTHAMDECGGARVVLMEHGALRHILPPGHSDRLRGTVVSAACRDVSAASSALLAVTRGGGGRLLTAGGGAVALLLPHGVSGSSLRPSELLRSLSELRAGGVLREYGVRRATADELIGDLYSRDDEGGDVTAL